jgi:hypothetical protein
MTSPSKEDLELGKTVASLCMDLLPDRCGSYRPAEGELVWAQLHGVWKLAICLDPSFGQSFRGMPLVRVCVVGDDKDADPLEAAKEVRAYVLPRVGEP